MRRGEEVVLGPGAVLLLLMLSGTGCDSQGPPEASSTPAPVPEDASTQPLALKLDNLLAGWMPTGFTVRSGDSVALFADGVFEVDGVPFEPRHMLWYRVGQDGKAVELIANHEIFTAADGGELFLTLRPLGILWSDRRGSYPDGFTSAPPVPADVRVQLLRLEGQPEAELAAMAAEGNADARSALDALAARKALPTGFDHLWFLNRANVWAEGTVDGRPGINAETFDDASIVKMPLDLPLTEETRFGFQWRYDALPALGPETEAQFHDYLSVALEFDNGEDLTWFWSRELAPGTHFSCPLPGWQERETHWVLQAGSDGLGQWFSHERPVLDDYRASIEGPEPTRITGVWFIANSLFGRQRAAASFADVVVVEGQERFAVFPSAP